jgi:hypothetical protein
MIIAAAATGASARTSRRRPVTRVVLLVATKAASLSRTVYRVS